MHNSFVRFLQLFFILFDLFVLNVIYVLTEGFFDDRNQAQYTIRYFQCWVVLNWFWITLALMGCVYREKNILFFDSFLSRTMRIFAFWTSLIIVYFYMPRLAHLSRPVALTTTGLFFFGLLFNRFLYLALRDWGKRKLYVNRKILILGYNSRAQKLASDLDREAFGIQIVGFVDDTPLESMTGTYPVYANLDTTLTLSKQLGVNEIYSTIMPENNLKMYDIMEQAEKEVIRFKVVADLCNLITKPVHIDFLRGVPILSLRREPLEEVVNRFNKRLFDIVVSGLITVFVLSWLVPLLSLLIYLESPGPVFFVQTRTGKSNKPFGCYKFRSMRLNSEANYTHATRITRLGRFMRKTSLDEFPQFINVLKGQMSVVGPRPHMLQDTIGFSLMEEHYMTRQFLKPGITGWAQVNGYRGEITQLEQIQRRVEFDLWYLEHWSFWLDVKIVFLTVYNVFKGEENAF